MTDPMPTASAVGEGRDVSATTEPTVSESSSFDPAPAGRAMPAGGLLLPIVVGVIIMVWGAAGPAVWGGHLLAGGLGVGVFFLARQMGDRLSPAGAAWGAVLAVSLIASTCLATGIEGVCRWHRIGGIQLHPSALLVPAVLVIGSRFLATNGGFVHLVWMTLQVVHVIQPDAGQATALGLGAAVATIVVRRRLRDWALAVGYLATAVLAWSRFDPLGPAPFVEDIVGRAFALSPVAGVAGVWALCVLVLVPLAGARRSRTVVTAGAGLSAYLVGALLAAGVGQFPVPFLGFGLSHVMGVCLGAAFRADSG